MSQLSLDDRMKQYYENRSKTYLNRRTPVIIRLDGEAFRTFTKHLKKPYDDLFHDAMNQTTLYLCSHIQGCKIGYTQSDEITLFLSDYDTLNTDAWLGYNVQKMCSIVASMATLAFNRHFRNYVTMRIDDAKNLGLIINAEEEYIEALLSACERGATFDARVFNVPKEEVTNCFIWRQQSCTRNAIQMLAQKYFSHKELEHKSCKKMQELLLSEHNVDFENMPTEFKRGACCTRVELNNWGTHWTIDEDIPVFTEDRNYIERYVDGEFCTNRSDA